MNIDISAHLETLEIGGDAILQAMQKCELDRALLLCQSTTRLVDCLRDIQRLEPICEFDRKILGRVTSRMMEIERELSMTHTKWAQTAHVTRVADD